MPYFSFSLKENFFPYKKLTNIEYLNIKPNYQYFSKNTDLYKVLKKKEFIKINNYIKYEKIEKVKKIGNKVLFFLPPSIGMGDAIEYALAIKTIIQKNIFERIAVAFTGNYRIIFEKYFNIFDLYDCVISESEINSFNTIYHFTKEIDKLKYQKYDRSDIEELIINKFNCNKYRNIQIENKKIKKITLFPISNSPIRCLPSFIINKIIKSFNKKYQIEIVFDDLSEISSLIEKKIILNNVKVLKPKSLIDLCKIIENINFGIFPDSGPLHLAKILGKKGILIETTVSNKILINGFNSINSFSSKYISNYCTSPCGLTNLFNFKNKIGCFDSLSINKKNILNNNLNSLQRGNLKKEYKNFVNKPVRCIKNINIDNLINKIKSSIVN